MATLGQIAEAAGVRPSGSSRNTRKGAETPGAAAGIASGTATGAVPRILEPEPVTSSASSSSTVGLATPAPAAERSASATDLYQRAIRDAERRPQQHESDPGGCGVTSMLSHQNIAEDDYARTVVRPIARSTSTPPEERSSERGPQQQHQQHRSNGQNNSHFRQEQAQAASPHLRPQPPSVRANSPQLQQQRRETSRQSSSGQDSDPSPNSDPSPGSHASTSIIPEHHRPHSNAHPSRHYGGRAGPPTPNSAAPHMSASSSPVYIQHHHQQPQSYAYHTQYYAPQYHYPPPSDSQQQPYYTVASPIPSHSPVHEPHPGMHPQTFYPHTYYYSTGQVLHTGSSSPNSAAALTLEDGTQSHFAMSDDLSNGHGHHARPYSAQSIHQAFQASMQHGQQYQQHTQQGLPAGMTYQLSPQPMQTYLAYNSLAPQGHQVMNGHSPISSPAQPYHPMHPPPMSPVMSHSYSYQQPASQRSSVDLGQHQYRPGQFTPVSPHSLASTRGNGGQHLRQSTVDSAFSASTPYSNLERSAGPSSYTPHSSRIAANGQAQQAPTELARGHLAQSKFREALGAYDPNARLPISANERKRAASGDSRLPKPPAHSPWAMWVGNVPSDATHSELWRFFSSRAPPGQPEPGSSEEVETLESEALHLTIDQPRPDYSTVGIDSIHLISRSNCCFVNMASKRHLEHAIKVSHGLSLRPHDPRCKPLVCRVRKKEDDTKTGVGAQRGKGMHQAWAAEKEKEKTLAQAELDGINGTLGDSASVTSPGVRSDIAPVRNSSVSTNHSVSTSSTTSSFLQRHFPKRYFILKSHSEDDLHLSVERGLWATQSHNEPVLDQAWRTAQSVFLIFGANKSGEFFGYAKMAGPVLEDGKNTPSDLVGGVDGAPISPPAGKSSSWAGRKPEPSILETPEDETFEKEPSYSGLGVPSMPSVLSPSGIVSNSPQPISNTTTPAHSKSADSKVDYLSIKAPQHNTAPSPMPCEKASIEARNASSLDPSILAGLAKLEIRERGISLDEHPSPLAMVGTAKTEEQLAAGPSNRPGFNDHGVFRKDTILSPEERNARLELLEAEASAQDTVTGSAADRPLKDVMEQGISKPFKIEWVRVQKLPFYRTRHLRNAFNGHREVKISRDGTEVEPDVGQQLLELFWKDPTQSISQQTSPLTKSASVASPMLS